MVYNNTILDCKQCKLLLKQVESTPPAKKGKMKKKYMCKICKFTAKNLLQCTGREQGYQLQRTMVTIATYATLCALLNFR